MSAAWMVLNSSSATPAPSTLMRWGWKRASGAPNRSPPTFTCLPSGSCTNERNRLFFLTFLDFRRQNKLKLAPTYRECLHQVSGLCGQMLLLLNVVCHIAELLLQHAHGLKVSSVVEGVAAKQQELMGRTFFSHICLLWNCTYTFLTLKKPQLFARSLIFPAHLNEVACDITSCDVQPACKVGQREALVHWTDVGDAVSWVNYNTGKQTCGQSHLTKRELKLTKYPVNCTVNSRSGFKPFIFVQRFAPSHPERTEWARPGWPRRCRRTGTSQTWFQRFSRGFWSGSWAAQSVGSWIENIHKLNNNLVLVQFFFPFISVFVCLTRVHTLHSFGLMSRHSEPKV